MVICEGESSVLLPLKNIAADVAHPTIPLPNAWSRLVPGEGCSGPNLLLLGPPGAGQSSLAPRLTSILLAMTLAEALETTRIHRVAGLTGARTTLVTTRPFRAPHHTISDVGLIGGGHMPMPGEGSRAPHGGRFWDE